MMLQVNNWHYLFSALLIGFLSVSGCAGAGKPIRFRMVTDTAPWVLRDEAAYLVVTESNWSQHYAVMPVGADFKANVYLVAYWGMKPNPGYQLKIVEVRQLAEKVTVKVEFREPEPGKFYPQVIVYPVSVVQIARKDLEKFDQLNFVFVDRNGKQLAEVKGKS